MAYAALRYHLRDRRPYRSFIANRDSFDLTKRGIFALRADHLDISCSAYPLAFRPQKLPPLLAGRTTTPACSRGQGIARCGFFTVRRLDHPLFGIFHHHQPAVWKTTRPRTRMFP